MSRAHFEGVDDRAHRVIVEFLNADDSVRARTVIGPYATPGAARGQATAARREATRNGGRVRTRLERSRDSWESVEVITE